MNLVERETELAVLGNLLDACRKGTGQVALISGAVAAGKTALLHALGERATGPGHVYLEAVASRTERASPMGVLGQLFRSRALPPVVTGRATRLLDDPPLIARLNDREAHSISDTTARAFEELCSLLIDFAEHHPVTIGVDDAQHADVPSLYFLLYLVRRVKVSRILVVLSECTQLLPVNQSLHAELLRQPGFHHIQLAPLSPGGVSALLADRLDDPAARRLAGACHAVSGGIPLLVQALAEDYRAAAGSRSPQLVFGRAFGLAITAFLYSCEPVVMHVASAASVLGDARSPALLAELLDITAESAIQGASVLSASGLLAGGRFRHDAVAAAVLGAMPADRRAAMNRRAARVLHDHGAAASILARHLLAADRMDVPWAAPLLQEAAEQALADGQMSMAISYLRRAQEECADAEQRATTRFMLTRAQWRVDPAPAARYLPELVTAVRAGTLGSGLAPALVPYLLWQGRPGDAAEALAAAERPADGVAALPPPGPGGAPAGPAAGLRAGQLWLDCSYPGHAGPAGLGERVPGRPRRPAVPVTSASTPQSLKGAAMLARALAGELGAKTLIAAEQILEASRLDDSALPTITAALIALICADQPDRAAFWGQLLLDDATERGVPTWQAVLRATCASIEVRRGNLHAAQAHAHAALSLLSPRGWGVCIGAPLAAMLLATTAAGRPEDAAPYLRTPVPDEMFQTPCGLMYLRARGRYYLSANRLHAALADFQACGERMIAWGIDLPVTLPWRTEAAQVYLRLGQGAEARELVDWQLELLGPGRSRTRGISLRVLAMTSPPRQRPALLKEAVDLLRESQDRLELARAFADLSQAHRCLGEHSRARRTASRAHRLAEQCGAEPLQRAVQSQAGAATPGTSGGASRLADLSTAERRVAVLAANGYTNQQIAGRLHVTVSTVEQHLTQVYRKLRVRRRTDLPPELQFQMVPAAAGK